MCRAGRKTLLTHSLNWHLLFTNNKLFSVYKCCVAAELDQVSTGCADRTEENLWPSPVDDKPSVP